MECAIYRFLAIILIVLNTVLNTSSFYENNIIGSIIKFKNIINYIYRKIWI